MNPDVYFFNSTCELAVGNGYHSYMPPARLRAIEEDLELIVSFLAKPNDIVVVKNEVPKDWISFILNCGFTLPEYLRLSEIKDRNLNFLRPWGWSPVMHFIFRDIYDYCSDSYKNVINSSWNIDFRDLYSRTFSQKILEELLKNTDVKIFPSIKECPISIQSIEELVSFDGLGNSLVMKSPWSSSGRGVRIIDRKSLSIYDKQWINGVIKQYGFVMLEKKFDKIIDFSLQYYINELGEVSFIGKTSFFTDDEGNYQGTNLHFEDVYRNNEDLKNIVSKINFQEIVEKHLFIIDKSKLKTSYYGYFGIDCLFYKDVNEVKVHPCIEINLRYNMGILALALSKKIDHNYRGYLCTKYIKNVRSFINKEKLKNPVCKVDNRLRSGFVNISIPNREDAFLSYITNYNE